MVSRPTEADSSGRSFDNRKGGLVEYASWVSADDYGASTDEGDKRKTTAQGNEVIIRLDAN